MDNRIGRNTQYTNWYEFRRELGRKLGYTPLNREWLLIKPSHPLPWNESHMKAALYIAICLTNKRGHARKGRQELALDRRELSRLGLAC